jgi:hypothetical protein
MTDIPGAGMATALSANPPASTGSIRSDAEEVGMRFEQLLWSEMLSHTGLEEAFTQSGGEAASAFSRMMIEAIAEDLARTHPLGLNATGNEAAQTGTISDD